MSQSVRAASVDLFTESGALMSPCQRYRYRLWRVWDVTRPRCCWLLLNPSTADAWVSDPTVTRCLRRAQQWGYGGVEVVNLFAYRSTDPRMLYHLDDPIGPENDQQILTAASMAGIVICGYGTHGSLRQRGAAVLTLLREAGVTPYALTRNADGSPGHPLYVGYHVQPCPMEREE